MPMRSLEGNRSAGRHPKRRGESSPGTRLGKPTLARHPHVEQRRSNELDHSPEEDHELAPTRDREPTASWDNPAAPSQLVIFSG